MPGRRGRGRRGRRARGSRAQGATAPVEEDSEEMRREFMTRHVLLYERQRYIYELLNSLRGIFTDLFGAEVTSRFIDREPGTTVIALSGRLLSLALDRVHIEPHEVHLRRFVQDIRDMDPRGIILRVRLPIGAQYLEEPCGPST